MLLSSNSFGQNVENLKGSNYYFIHDNDVFRFNNPTDQYYSFGLLLGFIQTAKPSSKVNKLFFFPGFKKDYKRVTGMELALKGYTPDFKNNESLEEVRPFAGTLTLSGNITEVNQKRILQYKMLFGVRGPWSGAEWVQSNFHQFIGSPVFLGWENQLPNKFLFQGEALYARVWDISPYLQILPQGIVSLGNYLSMAEPSLMFKIGKSLPLPESMLFKMTGLSGHRPLEFFLTTRFFGSAI
ncbi:lipid A-modifier LpxR family protein [Fontibacter flavus]|uniref:Lipid A-modifier LpxR family protein n=1 Tax=Fontibacter flavus TaxID=654838 RepID=A0ABV6FXQ6_9BACT